ncbi:hypothetical protein [Kribbella sp. VKM Ac-2566]|uniref:hypothetical protein n=1 Tax=Kribbella sp. VKM Ac-2566 TaxID=2512218 RepID=UPI0010631D3D|nr:hypothetical protein [Kribbella sp. VKM Ac-2566]TDW91105.1 hypothetical protein EV647_4674 [Kribbella sp. VKM Ac-2566]
MTTPTGSHGDELRARWSCDYLAEVLDLEAVPAYDRDGQPTGWVAIDPVVIEDRFVDLYAEGDD